MAHEERRRSRGRGGGPEARPQRAALVLGGCANLLEGLLHLRHNSLWKAQRRSLPELVRLRGGRGGGEGEGGEMRGGGGC